MDGGANAKDSKEPRGQSTVAKVLDDWYPLAESRELDAGPYATTLYGTPLVLFRGEDGRCGALLDRCAHRNVPLSRGKVRLSTIECFYHGWQFAPDGACKKVPCLVGEAETRGRRVPAYACREHDGFVWVYATPDVEPEREPYRFRFRSDPRYTSVSQVVEAEGTLHATAENALDVPHTAFLHGGLFRKEGAGNDIEVVVERQHDRVEAEYIGEPRPTGIAGRILAPQGGTVTHFDRFILPSIVEVEYRLGERTHFVSAAALTPLDDFRTRLFAVISFRLPVPGRPLVPILKPLAFRIFRQDAVALRAQTENIRRFGEERYMSTEVDILGNHILRLLRNAERKDRRPLDEPVTKRITMRV
ncbi:MAG: aromatic ring-hydroxylating dioxygenase subunit alpha [Myxococcota bacterium]